uniref:DEP domain-containing protein n=1 Tax=Strongyloides papillosus TaxID=174720 RepID=A0A0N5CB54_STREA
MESFFSVKNSIRRSVRNSFKKKISKTESLDSRKTNDLTILEKDIENLHCGKFKAIRKFVIILNLFKSRVPKKTHKVIFKKYDNVFNGKDAVDCLSNHVLPKIDSTGINYIMKAKKLIVYFLKERFLICLSNNFTIHDNSYTFSDDDIYCINENYVVPEIPLNIKDE